MGGPAMQPADVERFARVLAGYRRQPLSVAEVEVLYMLVVERLSKAEIADRRNVSINTIGVQKSLGRSKLRRGRGDVLWEMAADYWRAVGFEEGYAAQQPELSRARHAVRRHARQLLTACEALDAGEREMTRRAR